MAPTASQLPTEGYRLTGISPRAFQHPADRAATAALGAIPYLDRVVRKLIELGYERALRQAYLGSSVKLSEEQLPDVWREHALAYATLDMGEVPDLYLTQYPLPNALAIGAKRPIVVVHSELVALLGPEERRAVLAHEAAHILADHQLYRTALYILMLLTHSSRLPLPLAPVRTALLEWERATELSARPRGGARDARPAGGVPHADVPGGRRDGGGPRPRRLHEAGPAVQRRRRGPRAPDATA